jgi:hypothetical protein
MICGFWNSRSISAPARKLFIDQKMVPLNPDYIGFQDNKREEFTNSFLKQLLENRNFVWNNMPAVGTASGILV